MKNIDNRTTEYVMPFRIVKSERSQNIDNLLVEKPLQIGLDEPNLTIIKPNGYVILDFKREMCGGIRLLTYSASNVKTRIRLGESVSETCSEIGEKGSTNDHALRDIEVQLMNYSDMRFLESGFRFARIDNIGESDISLKSVYAVSLIRDIPYMGAFRCSDELVNSIYDTARYTVHLNMQNMLWDGIKRDRLVWIGDLHPEMLAINSVWGADSSVEQALTFAKEQTKLPLFMNKIPSYSMWWILILRDYYIQNGNIEYLRANADYLIELINCFNELVDSDGEDKLPFYFLDWGSHDKTDELAGVRALFVCAVKGAKYIYQVLGISDNVVSELLAKLLKKQYVVKTHKQAKAMQILAGIESASLNCDFLTEGGAKGMSTFMAYYILSAIAKGGQLPVAIDMLKEYYGGMLERGATTFWEDFDIEWLKGSSRIDELPGENEKDLHGDYGDYCYKGFRHSLCHGWSGGVLPFLTQYVLGAQPIEPGCKKVKIEPNLAGLTFAFGKYPTPYGEIDIENTLVGGKIVCKIGAPKEVEIVFSDNTDIIYEINK